MSPISTLAPRELWPTYRRAPVRSTHRRVPAALAGAWLWPSVSVVMLRSLHGAGRVAVRVRPVGPARPDAGDRHPDVSVAPRAGLVRGPRCASGGAYRLSVLIVCRCSSPVGAHRLSDLAMCDDCAM